jgi:branched-chain amino acid transport system substrate-binding protein
LHNGWKFAAALIGILASGAAAAAEKKYAPGVSDTEIKIGQTMPYSGPASAYGAMGQMQQAYVAQLNERGGINGRKLTLISLDDGYSPPRSIEQTRRLVEQDGVAFIFGSVGTAPDSATYKYLNSRGVPQLLLPGGADKFNDPKDSPWTTTMYPSYRFEGSIYAKYILKTAPDAKIAVIYQNDDFGRGYLAGFNDALGDKAKSMVVGTSSYELTDPTIDSQMVAFKSAGATTLVAFATPKFGVQMLRALSNMDWHPLFMVCSTLTSISAVLEPAGVDKAVGLISAVANKTPSDPAWKDDPDVKEYLAFMKARVPNLNPDDYGTIAAYWGIRSLIEILSRCGDDLSRENILKMATNFSAQIPLLLPGISIKVTPADYNAFDALQLQRFDGARWVRFGDPIRR